MHTRYLKLNDVNKKNNRSVSLALKITKVIVTFHMSKCLLRPRGGYMHCQEQIWNKLFYAASQLSMPLCNIQYSHDYMSRQHWITNKHRWNVIIFHVDYSGYLKLKLYSVSSCISLIYPKPVIWFATGCLSTIYSILRKMWFCCGFVVLGY